MYGRSEESAGSIGNGFCSAAGYITTETFASELSAVFCASFNSHISGATNTPSRLPPSAVPPQRVIVFRVLMFLLTLLVNALLWTTFSKALRHSASSLEAIVITTASNMLTTAVFTQVRSVTRVSRPVFTRVSLPVFTRVRLPGCHTGAT